MKILPGQTWFVKVPGTHYVRKSTINYVTENVVSFIFGMGDELYKISDVDFIELASDIAPSSAIN